jgi:ADP-heptose:LPS heptosyltransferase
MTGAIECLHEQHPGRYLTAVQTSCDSLFDHNPWVKTFNVPDRTVEMQYPLINESGRRPVHFLQGYVDFLAEELGIPLACTVNRPYVYLSDEEKGWLPQVQEMTGKPTRYWLVCSGTKADYTVKGWGGVNYQAVIDALQGRVQFVQVGEAGHQHPGLSGVIDLRGKTDARQLVRLCYHADGGLGGVSFLHHVFAALEKPFVCLASGFEPGTWERYDSELYLTRATALPCGNRGRGCWKARTVPLGDGDCKDSSLCERPFFGADVIPRCLAMIRPAEVVQAVESFYAGGLLPSPV